MSIYLNTKRPLENFKELYGDNYFVDKSEIISLLNEKISTIGKYVCITRPRRFGKSSVADMLGAYYLKAVDSKYIFDNLKISKTYNYEEHLNKYNVINISFNGISEIGNTYDDYIKMIRDTIKKDILEKYPHINPEEYFNLSSMLYDTVKSSYSYLMNGIIFLIIIYLLKIKMIF